MSTMILPEVGEVEVQTHVVVILPPEAPGAPRFVVEGCATVADIGTYIDTPGAYLKVISEWVCPDCNRVHFDQMDTDPTTWECG